MIFKTKFVGWNDVIAVDFTRTADSVRKTGADLGKWASEQQTKVKLFFLLRFFFFFFFEISHGVLSHGLMIATPTVSGILSISRSDS